jgi:hypothetical protein
MLTLVEVLQEDIDSGIRSNCESCPVARAMRRATGKHYRPGLFSVRKGFDKDIVANLPAEVTNFILAFDQGRTVQPFWFQIDLP